MEAHTNDSKSQFPCTFDESVPIGFSSSVFISKGTYCGWVIGADPQNKFHIRSVLSHFFKFANRVKRRPRNLLSCNVLYVVWSFAWVGVYDSFVPGWIHFEHGVNLSRACTVKPASKFCQRSNDERVGVALDGIVWGNLGEQGVPGFIRCSGYVQIKHVVCGHQEARALLEKSDIFFLDDYKCAFFPSSVRRPSRTTRRLILPDESDPTCILSSEQRSVRLAWLHVFVQNALVLPFLLVETTGL